MKASAIELRNRKLFVVQKEETVVKSPSLGTWLNSDIAFHPGQPRNKAYPREEKLFGGSVTYTRACRPETSPMGVWPVEQEGSSPKRQDTTRDSYLQKSCVAGVRHSKRQKSG